MNFALKMVLFNSKKFRKHIYPVKFSAEHDAVISFRNNDIVAGNSNSLKKGFKFNPKYLKKYLLKNFFLQNFSKSIYFLMLLLVFRVLAFLG